MIHKGKENAMVHFQSSFGEADVHIPIHVLDSVEAGQKVCVVISNNTYVIVTLLYHIPVFLQHGPDTLCVQAGVGDSTQYVPQIGRASCRERV
mgnify:CR=1 FL=1